MGRGRGSGELRRWPPPPWIGCNGVHKRLLSSTVGRIPPDPTAICVADVHCHQAVGHVSAVSSTWCVLQVCPKFLHRLTAIAGLTHDKLFTSSLLWHCFQSPLRLSKSVPNSRSSSIEDISSLVVVSWATTKKDLHTKSIELGCTTPSLTSIGKCRWLHVTSSSVLLATVVTHSVMR
jgi:hypothetical protein